MPLPTIDGNGDKRTALAEGYAAWTARLAEVLAAEGSSWAKEAAERAAVAATEAQVAPPARGQAAGRAVVVFSSTGEHWIHSWLHPQFKHVAVVVAGDRSWIAVDWRLGWPVVGVVADLEVDLVQRYEDAKHTVLTVDIPHDARHSESRPWPIGLLTCVTFAKRFLGIRAPFVVTPWSLYRYLARARRG